MKHQRPIVAGRKLGLGDDFNLWQLGKIRCDERHSKGTQPSSRGLLISRGIPASEKVGPGIERSRNMFCGELELCESKRLTLPLVNDIPCKIGVEAGRREHIQDFLVVGEQREFPTCGESVRKVVALATIA